MGIQDVAFMPSRTSFYTTSLENNGSGESLGTAMCQKTVVVAKGMHAVKYSAEHN